MRLFNYVTTTLIFWVHSIVAKSAAVTTYWIDVNPSNASQGAIVVQDTPSSNFSLILRPAGSLVESIPSSCERGSHPVLKENYFLCEGGSGSLAFNVSFTQIFVTSKISVSLNGDWHDPEGKSLIPHACSSDAAFSNYLGVVLDFAEPFSCMSDVSHLAFPVDLIGESYAPYATSRPSYRSAIENLQPGQNITAFVSGDWLDFMRHHHQPWYFIQVTNHRYKEMVFFMQDIKKPDLEKIVPFLKKNFPHIPVIPSRWLFSDFVAEGIRAMLPACDQRGCLLPSGVARLAKGVSGDIVVAYEQSLDRPLQSSFFEEVTGNLTLTGCHVVGFFATSPVSPELRQAACRALGDSCVPRTLPSPIQDQDSPEPVSSWPDLDAWVHPGIIIGFFILFAVLIMQLEDYDEEGPQRRARPLPAGPPTPGGELEVLKQDDTEAPRGFFCIMSYGFLENAVIASDGMSYSSKLIEQWFETKDISPMSSKQLKNKTLWPNYALREAIQYYKEGLSDHELKSVFYKCPITQKVFIDPVVASDGWTYERVAIVKIFEQENPISPVTKKSFANKALRDNISLKQRIIDLKELAFKDLAIAFLDQSTDQKPVCSQRRFSM